eukprot:6194526-Pleurochrysis_carterae.AAC.1
MKTKALSVAPDKVMAICEARLAHLEPCCASVARVRLLLRNSCWPVCGDGGSWSDVQRLFGSQRLQFIGMGDLRSQRRQGASGITCTVKIPGGSALKCTRKMQATGTTCDGPRTCLPLVSVVSAGCFAPLGWAINVAYGRR